jgi:hypothetical protein
MKSTTFRLLAGCGAVALVSLLAIPNVQAKSSVISSTTFGTNFTVRGSAGLDVEATNCDNTGSTVDITGELTFETGLQLEIVFKNNVKGTKSTLAQVGDATIVVLPGGGTASVPKQPVLGGVGGNPWISFGLVDSNSEDLSSQTVLGRCVQGAHARIDQQFGLAGALRVLAQSTECSSKRSVISFLTENDTGAGVDGVLLFDNNINKVVHRNDTNVASARLELRGVGPTQKGGWGIGGAGGNPLVFVRVLDNGDDLTGEINLGRCNKLGS